MTSQKLTVSIHHTLQVGCGSLAEAKLATTVPRTLPPRLAHRVGCSRQLQAALATCLANSTPPVARSTSVISVIPGAPWHTRGGDRLGFAVFEVPKETLSDVPKDTPPHYPAHALEYGAHTLTERRKQRARWLSTDERSGTLFEYRPVHCLHSHRFEEHVPGAAHQSDPPAPAAAAAAAPLVSRATFKDTCCSPPETR